MVLRPHLRRRGPPNYSRPHRPERPRGEGPSRVCNADRRHPYHTMEVSTMISDSAPRAATPGHQVRAEDHPGVIARPPRIAYLFLGIGLTLGWLWPWPLLPVGSALPYRYGIGAGLFALGAFILVLGLRAFRQVGTNVETWKPTTALA